MTAFFIAAYHYFNQRKPLFYGLCVVIFAVLGYWASRITFEEDIARLLPAGEDTRQLTEVMKAVEFTDKTVITIYGKSENPSPQVSNLIDYADQLIEKLEEADHGFIARIQGRIDDVQILDLMDYVKDNLPLFLDEADYRRLDSLAKREELRQSLNNWREQLITSNQWVSNTTFREDPFGLIGMGLQKFQQLQESDQFVLHEGFLMNPAKTSLFIFLTPSSAATETQHNAEFIGLLDKSILQLNQDFSEDEIVSDYYGATAVAVANAKQIKQDIIITLSIALVLLTILFIYFYRRVHIPLVILFPAAFGSLLGIAVLYLTTGTISAISIGIGSVLLGLTLDYSIHVLSHYRSTGDITALFRSTTKPLVMCAVFTAADFFCLLFLRSDVLRDLGVFAGISVLGAAFFALIFIPQVYKPRLLDVQPRQTFIDRLARIDFHRHKSLLFICLALIVGSTFTYSKVSFNDDLSQLNYQSDRLINAQNRLESMQSNQGKALYLVVFGEDKDAVFAENEQVYKQLQRIASMASDSIFQINSIAGLVLPEQLRDEKTARWTTYWNVEKQQEITNLLVEEGSHVGFRANTFEPFLDLTSQNYAEAGAEDNDLIHDLFLSEYISSKDGLHTVMTSLRIDPLFASRLMDAFNEHENVVIIDRKHLQEQFLGHLESDFDKLLLITSIAMFVILFLFFGSAELTLITNIPVFAGWFVTLGIMGAFGVQFNAFNIIITTLIFGLGIDYAIFVTKGMHEKFTFGKNDLSAYKSGIIMSALATLLCFGILIFARHPAIQSIAVIPLIGLLVVVFMSFTIQPLLFDFYLIKPQEKGNTPRRIWDILMTIYTFGYFFIGSFVLSVFAQLLIPIIPVSRKKKFHYFHKIMQRFFRTLMFGSPTHKIQIRGRSPEQFEKPVIVIANHTSQLDTPTVGMLHDKMIFVVNERVLSSKFFGRAIRMAGFYSTDARDEEGAANKLMRLREKIDQGYSIIVFPEGTRSRTAEVGRFRKGAFLLAEQLGLDLLPLMIHGNTDVLPKNDNVLKSGQITLQYLPLIKAMDASWGQDYSTKTKKVGRYFRGEFRKMRRELEQPDYFKTKLAYNFTYKPKHIRREAALIYEQRKESYHSLIREIPLKGTFLHLGCGYGLGSFIMAYDAAQRKITAWDPHTEKIAVAQQTYTVNRYDIRFTADIPARFFDFVVIENTQDPYNTPDLNAYELHWEDTYLQVFKNLTTTSP